MLFSISARVQERKKINQWVDLTAAFGEREGIVAGSWVNNWRVGRRKKWEIGLGARSTTVPFIIVFAGHEDRNIDTLTIRKPSTFSVNLDVNFGYSLSSRWYAGFKSLLQVLPVSMRY